MRGTDPGLLGAGQRMAGHEFGKPVTQRTPGPAMTEPFTLPTSVTIVSGASAGAMSRKISPLLPTGTAITTRLRVAHGVGGVDGGTIDDTELDGQLEVANAAAEADDFAYRIDLLQGPGQRAADKADTDDGETINHRTQD